MMQDSWIPVAFWKGFYTCGNQQTIQECSLDIYKIWESEEEDSKDGAIVIHKKNTNTAGSSGNTNSSKGGRLCGGAEVVQSILKHKSSSKFCSLLISHQPKPSLPVLYPK